MVSSREGNNVREPEQYGYVTAAGSASDPTPRRSFGTMKSDREGTAPLETSTGTAALAKQPGDLVTVVLQERLEKGDG